MEYILPFIDINSRRTSPKMASKQLNDLSIVRATPKLNTRVVALSTPIPSRCLTFRLSGIPLDMDADALCWGLDSLLVGEFSIKGNSKVFSLAAYSSWQVATVTFHDVPDEFSDCKPGHEKHVQLPKRVVTVHQGPVSINRNNPDHRVTSQFLARQADTGAMLVSVTVDCDFYGMTRLYQPAQVTAEYDIFAVTGLSAHAFGSWKAPEQAETMWLRDFLPLEFPNMRVHTWGYRSSIEDNRSKTSITDISRTFLEDVKRMRENQAVSRPLILIGHSLGGLVVQKALVDASKGDCQQDKAIHESCIGVLFFGVPIGGLNPTGIKSLVQGKENEYFLQSISSGSDYLFDLANNFGTCYKSMKNCIVVSFYEGVDTLSVEKSPDGRFERSGTPIRIVPRESAICSISEDSNKIAIHKDHSKMIKFHSRSDENYQRVISKIQDMVKGYEMRRAQERLQGTSVEINKRATDGKGADHAIQNNGKRNQLEEQEPQGNRKAKRESTSKRETGGEKTSRSETEKKTGGREPPRNKMGAKEETARKLKSEADTKNQNKKSQEQTEKRQDHRNENRVQRASKRETGSGRTNNSETEKQSESKEPANKKPATERHTTGKPKSEVGIKNQQKKNRGQEEQLQNNRELKPKGKPAAKKHTAGKPKSEAGTKNQQKKNRGQEEESQNNRESKPKENTTAAQHTAVKPKSKAATENQNKKSREQTTSKRETGSTTTNNSGTKKRSASRETAKEKSARERHTAGKPKSEAITENQPKETRGQTEKPQDSRETKREQKTK